MHRREFLIGAAAGLAAFPASAATAFRGDMWPSLTDKAAFVDWMAANRGEEPKYLERRFDRYRRCSPSTTCGPRPTSAPS